MTRLILWLTLIVGGIGTSATGLAESTVTSIGFFEGGPYAAHSEFRDHYRRQLEAALPPGCDVQFVPQGFKSAEWKRERSRELAAELATDRSVDMVVALGPWAVEDLLAAGFDRPIVAALRSDPVLEGLVDRQNHPRYDNLAVRVRPNKVRHDLARIATLGTVKKLGVLYFPADAEFAAAVSSIDSLARQQGMEVVGGEGYDRNGTYAFYKAADELKGKVDALYLGPLWGFDHAKERQFFDRLHLQHMKCFSAEGERPVLRGGMMGGSVETMRTTAAFHVWQTVQIIQGARTSDLMTVMDETPGVVINEYIADLLDVDLPEDIWLRATIIPGPAPDDIERLSLRDAVSLALTRNQGFLATYDALDAASAAASKAAAAYLPQVGISADVRHVDNNTVHNDDRFANNQYRAGLDFEQRLFSLSTIRNIRVARQDRTLATVDVRRAAIDLERAVHVAYLDCLQADIEIGVLEAYRRQVEGCLQLAGMGQSLGTFAVADLLRWESEHVTVLRSLYDLRSERKIAGVVLNTLVGRPGDYPVQLEPHGFGETGLNGLYPVLSRVAERLGGRQALTEALVASAYEENPVLRRLNAESDRRHYRLGVNGARFWPEFGVHARMGLVDERREWDGFVEEHATWSIGARLTLPLFLGGERLRERTARKAELRQLDNEREHQRLEVENDILIDIERMFAGGFALDMDRQAAELATRYVDEVFDRYGGDKSLLDMLDALTYERDRGLVAARGRAAFGRAVVTLAADAGWYPHQSGNTAFEELLVRLQAIVSAGN